SWRRRVGEAVRARGQSPRRAAPPWRICRRRSASRSEFYPVSMPASEYLSCPYRERKIDLIGPRGGRPEAVAISRSWASTTALAASSPSSPPSAVAGTRRFEVRDPSSYRTSNATKLVSVRFFIAMIVLTLVRRYRWVCRRRQTVVPRPRRRHERRGGGPSLPAVPSASAPASPAGRDGARREPDCNWA